MSVASVPVIRFSKPQYTRVRNAVTGAIEPCYRFVVQGGQELSDAVDRTLYPTDTAHLSHILRDQESALRTLIDEFLRCNSQYFVKQYTTDAILRSLNAQVAPGTQQCTEDEACIAVFTPSEFTIYNGKIGLIWTVRYEVVRIDIPALDEEVTVQPANQVTHVTGTQEQAQTAPAPVNQVCSPKPPVVDATEIESVYDIDSDEGGDNLAATIAPDSHAFESSSARQYDKRRLKEARLRARLAQYKVERAMSRYIEKYGDEATDSEWSESGSSESDSD